MPVQVRNPHKDIVEKLLAPVENDHEKWAGDMLKNANNPQEVTQSILDADLGVDGRHLIVISGLVTTDWKLDVAADEDQHKKCIVSLQYPVVDIEDFEQISIHTTLAGITNNDRGFTFASDLSYCDIDHIVI
jgi:hypothetical protein